MMRRFLLRGFLAVLTGLAALAFAGCDTTDPDERQGRIVFAERVGDTFHIFVMNADGSGKRQLTHGGDNTSPRWSPDGSTIIYGVNRQGDWNVYAINPDGTGERIFITVDPDVPLFGTPAWSPDGTRLVFHGGGFFYLINADGTGLQQLTDTPCSCGLPAWSPDGRKIAFYYFFGDEPGAGNFDLYVMEADGTGFTNLTNNPTAQEGSPAWSPDGRKIAFVQGDGLGTSNIYVMNADGTNQTPLTRLAHGDIAGTPTWSPDGTQIAFSRFNQGLFVMNADGSRIRRLGGGPSAVWPDWR